MWRKVLHSLFSWFMRARKQSIDQDIECQQTFIFGCVCFLVSSNTKQLETENKAHLCLFVCVLCLFVSFDCVFPLFKSFFVFVFPLFVCIHCLCVSFVCVYPFCLCVSFLCVCFLSVCVSSARETIPGKSGKHLLCCLFPFVCLFHPRKKGSVD